MTAEREPLMDRLERLNGVAGMIVVVLILSWVAFVTIDVLWWGWRH